MQRIDGDAGALQLLGEIDGEHDLRQLALRICAGAAVVPGDHHVGEIDRVLAERSDIDDARRRTRLEPRQQQMRQQEAGEIVDGEAQLVPVLAGLPRRSLVLRADAGVADQDIEALLVVEHQLGKLADIGERRKVGLVEHRLAAADPLDLVGKGLRPLGVAAVNQHPGA